MPKEEQGLSIQADISPQLLRVQAAFGLLPRNVFVIADSAPVISEELGIPLDSVMEILQTPNPTMYPDVPYGLQRIADAGSVPLVWTQGHLDDNIDIQGMSQKSDLSFQALKVVRSGLHEYLKQFEERCSQIGIPWIFGGFDKCDPNVVLPVLETAQQNGIRSVVAVDDLEQNLMQMNELCQIAGMPYVPCHMIRNKQTSGIQSFNDITIVNNALYFIDLDRTQIDTDGMKNDLYMRLARLL